MKSIATQKRIIKRYEHAAWFYGGSLIISWTFWFMAGHFSHLEPFTVQLEWITGILSLMGLLTPLIIALYFMLPDQQLRQDLWGRMLNFKNIKGEYLLITFFLMFVSILTAQAISLLFGYSPDQFQLRGGFTFNSAIFPVWFLLIAAPVIEELAWHSYGTDCLRARFSLFTTSLIFAIFWGVWHLPLSFIKDYYHSNLVESGIIYSLNFLISLIPFVLIMNWLYYKTNRNLILPVIFHLTAGFFNEIFATQPMSKVIQTGLLLLFSLYLIIQDKAFFLKSI
ncbi:MAG: CPBP family intramembrane glutamic endopeptidase [Candidatus Cyclobacteriaceae bacterium M3_2C_046]